MNFGLTQIKGNSHYYKDIGDGSWKYNFVLYETSRLGIHPIYHGSTWVYTDVFNEQDIVNFGAKL